MEELDYWRLCEELNIVQATLLIIGEDASVAEYAEGWEVHKRPINESVNPLLNSDFNK